MPPPQRESSQPTRLPLQKNLANDIYEITSSNKERLFPHVSAYAARLGRTKTDQTSGLVPIDAEDPLFSMLNAIRAMPIRC